MEKTTNDNMTEVEKRQIGVISFNNISRETMISVDLVLFISTRQPNTNIESS